MKKLVLLLLTIAVLVGSLLLIGNTDAPTPVSGTITSDITWTKAGSPYELTGTVLVNSGVTLLVAQWELMLQATQLFQET